MKILLFLPLIVFSGGASALEIGSWRLDGRAAVGSNLAQGTNYTLGADFYTYIEEDVLAAGIGAYWSAGQHPNLDREMGVGPFVSYAYPVFDFLIASAREDISYVDQRTPFADFSNYKAVYGVGSFTSRAMHLFFTKNFNLI